MYPVASRWAPMPTARPKLIRQDLSTKSSWLRFLKDLPPAWLLISRQEKSLLASVGSALIPSSNTQEQHTAWAAILLTTIRKRRGQWALSWHTTQPSMVSLGYEFSTCLCSSPLSSTINRLSLSSESGSSPNRASCGIWVNSSIRRWNCSCFRRMAIWSSTWSTKREFWHNTQSMTSKSQTCS